MTFDPSDLSSLNSSIEVVSTKAAADLEDQNLTTPMSDWFRVYNDLLDEPNFRYALGRSNVVGTVYMALLSEASKRRSCVVPWTECEEIGTGLKLNVSAGILCECVNALCEAHYIRKEPNSLVICDWDKTQSDYCRGLSKGYYKKLVETTSLATQRRGEKKRKPKFLSGPLPGESTFLATGEMPHDLS